MESSEFYTPKKGDIIWMNPKAGSTEEDKKRRPGLVVSNNQFNQSTLLVVICPITATIQPGATRFTLKDSGEVKGQVLIPQLESLDTRNNKVEYIEKLSISDMAKIDQVIGYIF
ncbi:type II toxin-antitoxin system PemK/MazF family toxin [Enterococcus alishanensis]